MTAVASPPSVQEGPRLGWYDSGKGGQGALTSMNDEVSRMFMPRKSIQRSNSSSSLGSNSSTSTVVAGSQNVHAVQSNTAESCTWSSKKKSSRLQVFQRGVPLDPLEERIPKLPRNLGIFFDLGNLDLHTIIETRQEITANDQAVRGSPDGVDPARWNQHGIAFGQIDAVTLFGLVAKERGVLRGRVAPVFIFLQMLVFRWDEEKSLFAF